MSSEIIHGTPLLIYSNREYFYFLTLISTYESFFRLENIFKNVVTNYFSKQQLDSYSQMRSIYYSRLVSLHKREINRFNLWQNKHKN